MKQEVEVIERRDAEFPEALESTEITKIWAIGQLKILNQPMLGLFCSAKCPGEIILQAFDAVRAIRDAGIAVIGGFHSPMEKECLDLLLRGQQPLVICPARGIQRMRIPAAWRAAAEADRALVVSPFDASHQQPTADLSQRRNRFAAILAAQLFVPHADPGSKTEKLCREFLQQGKSVFTLECEANRHLLDAGLRRLKAQNIAETLGQK